MYSTNSKREREISYDFPWTFAINVTYIWAFALHTATLRVSRFSYAQKYFLHFPFLSFETKSCASWNIAAEIIPEDLPIP
jgi:hypothetical protein